MPAKCNIMIEIKNLGYRYGRNGFAALTDVSATVGPGIYLLLGENGAGKTTLLKSIAGMLMPTAGSVEIDGMHPSTRVPSVLSKVFYLGMETDTFMRDISVMMKHHACFYPGFDEQTLNENLRVFNIDPKQKLREMSTGNRHKAMLSYALSLNTEVLLLDEPANGLDIESKEKLLRMIASAITPDRIIIISTHTISDLVSLFDGVMILQGGSMKLSALSDDILERLAFASSYSEIPGALYSEWSAGQFRSILPVELAEERGIGEGNIDYRLLYSSLHSSNAGLILDILRTKIPFEDAK